MRKQAREGQCRAVSLSPSSPVFLSDDSTLPLPEALRSLLVTPRTVLPINQRRRDLSFLRSRISTAHSTHSVQARRARATKGDFYFRPAGGDVDAILRRFKAGRQAVWARSVGAWARGRVGGQYKFCNTRKTFQGVMASPGAPAWRGPRRSQNWDRRRT